MHERMRLRRPAGASPFAPGRGGHEESDFDAAHRPPAEAAVSTTALVSPTRLGHDVSTISVFAPGQTPLGPALGAPLTQPLIGGSPAGSATTVVQRYQAGERGHGGIEAEALAQVGFGGNMTSGEIGQVYLGNWMRDWSQLGDPHNRAVLTILNVLSMGEFNRPVSAEQVGGYLPSEHLDNPAGGGSVEDPTATSMPLSDWKGLSRDQQSWVREEQSPAFQAYIDQRAQATDLPTYIEAGKEHAKRELTAAAQGHRGDREAMAAMGNGLHAVEDYFSHSNFTDAAVYMLVREGAIPRESPVYQRIVARAHQFGYDPSGYDPAREPNESPRDDRITIVSGTYRSAGNKKVSLLEQIESEVKTGALRRAWLLGAIRLGMVNGADLGGSAGGAVGEGLVGGLAAVGGTLVEGGSGLAHGLAAGWERGHGVGAVWDAVHDAAVGGEEGAAYGAANGWRLGAAEGRRDGAAVGGAIGEGLGAVDEAVVMGTIDGLFSAAIATAQVNPVTSAVIASASHLVSEQQTRAATAADRAAGDTTPNHSELAKDDVDHPLFGASRSLAVLADEAIGAAMIAAWDHPGDTAALEHLVALVDKYVCHPAHENWWRAPLTAALQSGGAGAGAE